MVRPAWWSRASRSRARGLLVAGVLLGATCTGCTGGSGGATGTGAKAAGGGKVTSSAAAVSLATVQVQPGQGATGVAPADPVVVTAAGGKLSDVVVVSSDGGKLRGTFDADHQRWQSVGKLAFGATYRVTAAAANVDGKPTTAATSFTTAKAAKLVFPAVSPLRGTTVGVGMPIRVYLDQPVTDRKAVEAHLKVTASVPTEGAWRWFSTSELHWRPAKYWKAGTDVALEVTLRGVRLGDGVWGGVNADRHIEFSVGAAHVSVADARSHVMKVYTNGRLVKSIPVSLGKEVPGRYTKSGVHLVVDKNRVKTMDSTTFGLALDAGGYRANVEWATRISNNGEFVHSAPWSVAQQGHSNVSHGCVNASPANAQWFFNYSQVGDVVNVVGTPVKLGPKDGDIYDWTVPWSAWAN